MLLYWEDYIYQVVLSCQVERTKDCSPVLSSTCLYVNKPTLFSFSHPRKTQDFHRTCWWPFMQLPLLHGVFILYNKKSLGELRIQSMCCHCLSLSALCHSQCPTFLCCSFHPVVLIMLSPRFLLTSKWTSGSCLCLFAIHHKTDKHKHYAKLKRPKQ